MKTNIIKKIFIVLICSIGLYTSGNHMVEMSNIKTLLNALNVMIFFTCLFPFIIVFFSLINQFFKSILRLIDN